ncbi:MAG: class I SAM-dependent methyltransferase [Kiritimatiellia bacterium]
MNTETYALLDSGLGRKLERFGRYVLARPCAQALWQRQQPPADWDAADATFDREEGQRWQNRDRLPERWTIEVEGVQFRLSGTDFGHLGIFPEQRGGWHGLSRSLRKAAAERPDARPRVLNLFAYSGGSTLAAAHAGAEVCHVDASTGMVQWARENAALNNLQAAPIRWIVDDAHKFLTREIKRGRRYDAVILDPPSFGRGAQGEVYKIERDLPQTLELCRALLSDTPLLVLLSAHTPGITPTVLRHMLQDVLGNLPGRLHEGEMLLTGADHVRPVPNGCYARWETGESN